MTAVEAATAIAILAAVLAVGVPAFVRDLHASRLTEPVAGLERLGASAVAYSHGRDPRNAMAGSAPLTPSVVPRATLVVDPPGTWDAPAWRALAFRASPEGAPHAFAFTMDATSVDTDVRSGAVRGSFVARAHGDLDGDGVTSTFEIRGRLSSAVPPIVLEPGMYVESELE
jgi:hypothetical protein